MTTSPSMIASPIATTNPRSVLHALKPLGQGSDQAESLLSYFCRLALSRKLMAYMGNSVGNEPGAAVNAKYAWYERKISGLGDGAKTYTEALAATTSVVGLERHTFLPWQGVIPGNGLALHKCGQFCPYCLQEDLDSGGTPYLRLCWEPVLVSVCHRHGTPLVHHCPHCGVDKARHTSAFTVVGWCGKCGMFMGRAVQTVSSNQPLYDAASDDAAGEVALWQAQQIARLVEVQQSAGFEPPLRDGVIAAIERVIETMFAGQYSLLAKQVGIAKATLHTWLRESRTPQVDISLRIARFAQLDLADLLMGNMDGWSPPVANHQLALALDYPARPEWNRRVHTHDWEAIEGKLQAMLLQPMPVSLMHAASVVQMPPRMLYMKCNKTARRIANRWLTYLKRRQQSHVVAAWPFLESACRQLLDRGISPNMREIEPLVPVDILNRVCNCWDVLREVRAHIESSEYATAALCGHHYPQRWMQE
ncbi:TniQ family protein [Comamonas testosteroni]